jgi:hypothetical protein
LVAAAGGGNAGCQLKTYTERQRCRAAEKFVAIVGNASTVFRDVAAVQVSSAAARIAASGEEMRNEVYSMSRKRWVA